MLGGAGKAYPGVEMLGHQANFPGIGGGYLLVLLARRVKLLHVLEEMMDKNNEVSESDERYECKRGLRTRWKTHHSPVGSEVALQNCD